MKFACELIEMVIKHTQVLFPSTGQSYLLCWYMFRPSTVAISMKQ